MNTGHIVMTIDMIGDTPFVNTRTTVGDSDFAYAATYLRRLIECDYAETPGMLREASEAILFVNSWTEAPAGDWPILEVTHKVTVGRTRYLIVRVCTLTS